MLLSPAWHVTPPRTQPRALTQPQHHPDRHHYRPRINVNIKTGHPSGGQLPGRSSGMMTSPHHQGAMPTMHTCGRPRRRQTRRDATHALPVTMHPHTAAAAHRRIIPIPAPCPIGDGPRRAGFGMVPTLRRRLPDGQPRDRPSSHALRGARGERKERSSMCSRPYVSCRRVVSSSSAVGARADLARLPDPGSQSRVAIPTCPPRVVAHAAHHTTPASDPSDNPLPLPSLPWVRLDGVRRRCRRRRPPR